MLFVYLSFPNSSSTLSCSLHRTQLRYGQGVVLLLGKFKSKGNVSFSLSKVHKPDLFSNLCFWFVQALGNGQRWKRKGACGIERWGEVERDREIQRNGMKKEKERSTRTWNSLTLPLTLSLSYTQKTQKRLTGWSFKALASLYPSSGVEFQCGISFFIGGLGRARRLGQDECVFFQGSTSVPWRPSYSADVFIN